MILHNKQSLHLRIALSLLLIIVTVFAGSKNAQAESSIITITLSDSGWSDPAVGTWDPVTKSGVLTQDIIGTIQIISNGITLDGGGYSITGDGSNNGVYAESRDGIIIKNLNITGCNNGILLSYSRNSTVSGNILSNNSNADLYLYETSNTLVTGNQMTGSAYAGLLFRKFANNNTICDNLFRGNEIGICLQGVQDNTIYHNTVQENATGIFITDLPSGQTSRHNLIYQNNFIDNSTHAYVFKYEANVDNRFFLNIPDGGNYWSGQSFEDTDLDGISNTSFIFTGGQDGFPWMAQNGWESYSGDPTAPSYLYVYLTDDGWSEPVGTWDAVNRVATLTQDINGSIIVASSNVILEGNGHKVYGNGNGIGIQMIAQGYNTIRNICAENHASGIYFDYTYENVVESCTAANSLNGIYLHESRRNQLLNNEIPGNTYGIVLKTLSDENTLSGNLVADNDYGIDIPGSFSNIIAQNTIRNSSASGISIRIQPYSSNASLQPDHNKIYNNDFINNAIQASVNTTGTDNLFNLLAPTGGNYWNDHISSDANSDGFADTPYIFSNGQDNLPVIRPFNWHPASDDPVSAAAEIMDVFDQAVIDGTISGNGDPEKLNGFRDKLTEVYTKLEAGELRAAYQLLKTVYGFIDGKGKPKDLITGPATAEISEMVAELLERITP